MTDKIGKTFTIDLDVYVWLGEYAKEHKQKQSAIVNTILRRAKKSFTSWECSVCGLVNTKDSKTCYSLVEGEFCKGVKPWFVPNVNMLYQKEPLLEMAATISYVIGVKGGVNELLKR